MLEQRPDILQAEQSLVAANARIGVARALYFPRVALTGAYGTASVDTDKLFEAPSEIWQISGNVLAPIFTFGTIEGQVMTAKAQEREAVYRYQQTIISAFREVEDALASTTKGRQQLDAQGRQVQALATYARKLEKGEALLDWSRPAVELERQVRAFNPWPVAQTGYPGQMLRVGQARAVGGEGNKPGRVVAAGRDGGTRPAAYNAANEVAVRAFLEGRLSFPGIPRVVERVLASMPARAVGTLEDVKAADAEARRRAGEAVSRSR